MQNSMEAFILHILRVFRSETWSTLYRALYMVQIARQERSETQRHSPAKENDYNPERRMLPRQQSGGGFKSIKPTLLRSRCPGITSRDEETPILRSTCVNSKSGHAPPTSCNLSNSEGSCTSAQSPPASQVCTHHRPSKSRNLKKVPEKFAVQNNRLGPQSSKTTVQRLKVTARQISNEKKPKSKHSSQEPKWRSL